MRDTWLRLVDGRVVHPGDCKVHADGVLAHKSGTAVAMRGDALSSYGVDLTAELIEAREFTPAGEAPAALGGKPSRPGKRGKGREFKPDEDVGGAGYKTRGTEVES